MTKFEQGKYYPTRNDGRALILGWFPHGGMYVCYYQPDGSPYAANVALTDGRYYGSFCDHEWDILPPPPEAHEGWFNLYRARDDSGFSVTGPWESRDDADTWDERRPEPRSPRVGCHRITLRAEFEEAE